MASGTGLCMMYGVDQDTCESHNGVWYNGRAWSDGLYNSNETCGNTCLFGDYYFLGLADDQVGIFSFSPFPIISLFSHDLSFTRPQ